MDKVSLPLILGTLRQGRQSENVAKFVMSAIEQRDDIESRLFDVRDFAFDSDEGQAMKDKNPQWRDAIVDGDGLIIVAPEYNHGYPGSLKYALDMLLPEYMHKAVGLVGVSAGPFGGTRVVEALLPVMREFSLTVSGYSANFSGVGDMFDESGALNPEAHDPTKSVNKMLDDVVFLAKSLRWGRENLK